MNPAEPETRTFWLSALMTASSVRGRSPGFRTCCSGLVVQRGDARRFPVDLLERERGAEREAIPAQVLRDPRRELEVRLADVAVEPDGRQLGDRAPEPPRLRRQLEADLEPAAAV